MTAAQIAESKILRFLSGQESEQVVAVTTTTTGDWFMSRFGTIVLVQCTGNGHVAFVSSVSGSKVTLTCTGGDVVYLTIRGY